jgi:hypothetical protein
MTMKISSASLLNQSEWDALAQLIAPGLQTNTLRNLLKRLRDMGAKSAAIEEDYLDQDFTAEFARFYAKLFKRHSKVCKRIHFFEDDVRPVLAITNPQTLSDGLEKFAEKTYLGFIVIRPISHAPVGRTIIKSPPSPTGMKSKLLVRAEHTVHFMGANFAVVGVPLVQQDSRVGACAQASIWIAGRHFHARHRGPWFSVAQITEEALKPADTTISQSLPAGSGFLQPDNMVRALRAMGREPFAYIKAGSLQGNPPTVTYNWPALVKPHEVINRYIDSGIPVILGLDSWTNQRIGHAVVAVGHTIRKLGQGVQLPLNPTRAEYCEAFLVNDDQLGSYLRMPRASGSSTGETPYTVDDQLRYLLIPLPEKVYLPAEFAERVAWDLLDNFYTPTMAIFKADKSISLGTSVEQYERFVDFRKKNEIVARTYLTYGWKYRRRMLRNTCVATIKEAIIVHDLPKYVWVTEFGAKDDLDHLDPKDRRILAHVVTDATSSQFLTSNLLFHGPGLFKRWFHNPTKPFGDFSYTMIPIPDDTSYLPKIRGA